MTEWSRFKKVARPNMDEDNLIKDLASNVVGIELVAAGMSPVHCCENPDRSLTFWEGRKSV